MGRRKIEIKAIKDDRNRSVYVCTVPTFAATQSNYPQLEITLCPRQLLRRREDSKSYIVAIESEHLLILLLSTFLKRKGGLFKKAHELSVLCSVDVAVIIFGHNKKLYEYSSGDINETIGRFQYVRANE